LAHHYHRVDPNQVWAIAAEESPTRGTPASLAACRRSDQGHRPRMVEWMVSHLGLDIMHIVDDEPSRLVEVPALARSGGSASRLRRGVLAGAPLTRKSD
jgi:hypothetical protein